MQSNLFRFGCDILIIFLMLLLPWWLSVIAVLLGLFFFDNYYEIIFFGFLLDSLYSPAGGVSKYLFTIIGFGLFYLEIFLKQRIRI